MPLFFSAPAAKQWPYLYVTGQDAMPHGPPPVAAMILAGVFGSPPPTKPITSGPFTISPPTSKAAYYALTAAGADITDFSTATSNVPIRAKLRADVTALLTSLEPQLVPGGLALVRRTLSEALPQTFAESLYYRYGCDPANRYTDIHPGMRLRVDWQSHQPIDPSAQNSTATAFNPLNGFVGTGTSYIDVIEIPSSSGTLLTGFDAFLSSLASVAVAANSGGAAGAIDLQGNAFAYPYFRLFYPQTFPTSDGIGSTAQTANAVIYGAATLADLEAATQSYLANGVFNGKGSAAYFRGRATVVPEIAVLLQGATTYVPLGTTMRAALQRFGPVPRLNPASITIGSLPPQWFYRWQYTINPALVPGTVPAWVPFAKRQVTLDAASGGGYQYYSAALDSFDVPLLGGDMIQYQL
jgi:hypothetical protein